MIEVNEEKRTIKEDSEKSSPPISNRRLSGFLDSHSKSISTAIAIIVIISIMAVSVQVSPIERIYPAAKDFRMMSTDNPTWVRLSDNLGKVVLIDFMATWCSTCQQSMPDLLEIHRMYSAMPFELISVTASSADNLSDMQQFKTLYSANWTFALPFDISTIVYNYGIQGFPTYVILDREGQITFKSVGLIPLEVLVSHINATLNS